MDIDNRRIFEALRLDNEGKTLGAHAEHLTQKKGLKNYILCIIWTFTNQL